jgi:hypothetical protein
MGKPTTRLAIDRQRHSNILDVQSFIAADCDTDHCLVVSKIRERLAVNKHGLHTFHMERLHLRKLNEVEGKEKYRVEVSNRFAALEGLNPEVEINIVWGMIRENIKISAKESLAFYELKKHKTVFDEGCSELLDQKKQARI